MGLADNIEPLSAPGGIRVLFHLGPVVLVDRAILPEDRMADIGEWLRSTLHMVTWLALTWHQPAAMVTYDGDTGAQVYLHHCCAGQRSALTN